MVKTNVHTTNREAVENLAFAQWQYNANEKAYENNLITVSMYEFAKNELQRTVDILSKLCYNVHNEAGVNSGIKADAKAT